MSVLFRVLFRNFSWKFHAKAEAVDCLRGLNEICSQTTIRPRNRLDSRLRGSALWRCFFWLWQGVQVAPLSATGKRSRPQKEAPCCSPISRGRWLLRVSQLKEAPARKISSPASCPSALVPSLVRSDNEYDQLHPTWTAAAALMPPQPFGAGDSGCKFAGACWRQLQREAPKTF